MNKITQPTNATKAQLLAAVNALIVLVTAFGLELTADQIGAITLAVNALFALWVGLTYRDSPKRVPEE